MELEGTVRWPRQCLGLGNQQPCGAAWPRSGVAEGAAVTEPARRGIKRLDRSTATMKERDGGAHGGLSLGLGGMSSLGPVAVALLGPFPLALRQAPPR